jgi:hypothetical protein
MVKLRTTDADFRDLHLACADTRAKSVRISTRSLARILIDHGQMCGALKIDTCITTTPGSELV